MNYNVRIIYYQHILSLMWFAILRSREAANGAKLTICGDWIGKVCVAVMPRLYL